MPQEHLHNPHDRFFKQTFGNPDTAGAFFREFLPPALARQVNWTDLKRIDGSFIDQTLRERHADLLFSVPWNGRNLMLYCLFEHQSSEDRRMPLRLLRYMVRIWEKQLRNDPRQSTLAPIIPIVLHQGDKRWQLSPDFRSLLDFPVETAEALSEFIPDFRFRLVDLADLPVETLRGNILLHAILTTMKVARSGDFLDRIEEIAPLLSGALRETDLALVRVCLEYLLRGSKEVDLKSFRDKVQQLKISEIRSDVMTLAEQLIQEGRLEGRQEGRHEGRQEGERLLLERQFIRRFGALPDWVSRKLEEATTDQLEQWGEAILDAPSLESVFRE